MRHLAEEPGVEVVVADDFSRGALDSELEQLAHGGAVELLTVDLARESELDAITGRFDEVYHFAAVLGVKRVLDDPLRVLDVNVVGTLNLLRRLGELEHGRLLLASTSEVYAWTRRFHELPVPTPEDVPLAVTDLDDARSCYAASKILSELAVTQWGKALGRPFTIVRYHNVYGPRMGYDHVIPELYQRAVAGQDPLVVYSPRHRRAFCYVDDAVARDRRRGSRAGGDRRHYAERRERPRGDRDRRARPEAPGCRWSRAPDRGRAGGERPGRPSLPGHLACAPARSGTSPVSCSRRASRSRSLVREGAAAVGARVSGESGLAPGAPVAAGGIPLAVPHLGGNEWALRPGGTRHELGLLGRAVRRAIRGADRRVLSAWATRWRSRAARPRSTSRFCSQASRPATRSSCRRSRSSRPPTRLATSARTRSSSTPSRSTGSWTRDKVAEFLERECAPGGRGARQPSRPGRRVRAVLPVHVLGHPVDLEPLLELADRYGLAVVEDAAESLGARYRSRALGTFGLAGCLSFNGNKVITTGGGGMVVTDDAELAARARYLATQAKDDPVEYVHGAVGFNYRLSNVLAAIGCAQLEVLDEHVAAKRAVADRYSRGVRRRPRLDDDARGAVGVQHSLALDAARRSGRRRLRQPRAPAQALECGHPEQATVAAVAPEQALRRRAGVSMRGRRACRVPVAEPSLVGRTCPSADQSRVIETVLREVLG